LTEEERQEIVKHYENLKIEMMTDVKQLSEQNKLKHLEAMASALEKRFQRIVNENDELSHDVKVRCDELDALKQEHRDIEGEIERLEFKEEEIDKSVREEIKSLILQNEKMKTEETAFKENCTRIIEELHRQIDEAEILAAKPDENFDEFDEELEKERETLRICRLQLAKKNRAVLSLQRQLDNIPDNTELAQYQKRFLELYNNISVKHKETKQFYALYNTLNDKHLYLEKEISLLNSIYDNYHQ
jgi:chromosome segregation ATPase